MRKQGLYWCNGCQEWLPTTAYGSRYGYCLKCYAAIQRKRYEQNPDPFKSASRKRKRLSKPIPMHERKILIKMFGGKCAYCQQRKYRHWDHVVPLSAGGDSKFGNIAPACQRCNMSKHNKELFSWMSEKGFTPSSILLAYLNGRATASLYEYPPRKGRPGHLNQAAKLTKCQVPEIREKYASGQYSYPELAKEYNVCTATIGRVVRRETYGNQD